MQVLISIDMEGVAGIATPQQTMPGGADYQIGRELMTAEANAAVAGAFDGGAKSVIVNDSHGPMDNLLGEKLDSRADYVVGAPKPMDMMQELSKDIGVALFVGYHAGATDPVGVLAHTYAGGFADVRLGGHSVTEAELNALIAAAAGVPVGMVSGDDMICGVAEKAFPGVIAVQVKTAIGWNATRSLSPVAAGEAIRAGAARAVANAVSGVVRPVTIPDELVLEVELRLPGVAELAARVPGTERVDGRTVRRRVSDPNEMFDVLVVWTGLADMYVRKYSVHL
jgi:D-amino peptidase